MSNILNFLVKASEQGLTREQFLAAIDSAELSDAEKALLQSGDHFALRDYMGAENNVVCAIAQPEPDGDEEEEEEEGEKKDSQARAMNG